MKENIFWHVFQATPPPKNCTPGLIPLLKRTFTKLHSRGVTTRAVLCSEGVCHVGTEFCMFRLHHHSNSHLTPVFSRLRLGLQVRFPSSVHLFKWLLTASFCPPSISLVRYRNFLMACTSLIAQQSQPMYFPLLDVGNGSFAKVSQGKPQELRGPGVRALQAWIEDAWRRGKHLLI